MVQETIENKSDVYGKLKEGKFGEVENIALAGIEDGSSSKDFENILQITKFWSSRSDFFVYSENHLAGEKLFSEWDKFIDFCKENSIRNKQAFIAIKEYVFTHIVDILIDAYKLSPIPDKEILILLGQAFYEIGMLDKARETLEYALSISKGNQDVRIYIILGNLYYEIDEIDFSMVMFGEAFLKFPQMINLDYIDYPAVHNIAKMIAEDGVAGSELIEWIPVYGYIYGGLTTKRKISSHEYAELKRRILEYEESLKMENKVINIIIPRLINYYLWLFDYYLNQTGAISAAEQTVKRIVVLIKSLSYGENFKVKNNNKAQILFKNLIESAKRKYNRMEKQ